VIRILIVDDHPVVRRGIKQILSEHQDFEVTAEADSFARATEVLKADTFDLIVLDLSMPDRSGLDLIELARREYPATAILVLSILPAEQYAVRVLRAGASGYLTKQSAPEELVVAIRRIASGHRYLDEVAAEQLADAVVAGSSSLPHESLSSRELQVLCLIGQGRSAREIAETLFLSPKSVSTYRSRVLKKMKMATNAELIRYVLANHLVE
jgi:two-component system, NarL family, invasion response regulator UvrY